MEKVKRVSHLLYTTMGKWLRKEYKSMIVATICGLIITTGITFAGQRYSKDVTREISSHLIRFHVVANSDTVEDQQMKEHIRDVVLAYMSPLLKKSATMDQTRLIIKEEIPQIEQLAHGVITKWGKDYDVNVLLDQANFPTKQYGDIMLPAGEYEACRIIIGEGKGQNWWCVMFPPLCYVDVTHGIVPSEHKAHLQKTLPKEEYELITKSIGTSNKDIPVKFKFKVVELFNKKGSNYQMVKSKNK